MSKYVVNNVLIWGSGSLAFKCARYLEDILSVSRIYEYDSFPNSQLQELCRENNYSYTRLNNHQEADNVVDKILEEKKKVLIISASNTYLFPDKIIKDKNVIIINYHPALLDKHRGRNAEAWSIYERDTETGVTWHVVTDIIDNGTILAQKRITIDDCMTSLKLMAIQYQIGYRLFTEFIDLFLQGQMTYNVSFERKLGKIHYSYEKPNNGVLDLSWDEQKMSALLRSMDYGKMKLLGKVRIYEKGKAYEWSHYKIYRQGEMIYENKNSRLIYGNSMIIELFDYHER